MTAQVTDCYLTLAGRNTDGGAGLGALATDCYLEGPLLLAQAGFAGRSNVARRRVIPVGRGVMGETGCFPHAW